MTKVLPLFSCRADFKFPTPNSTALAPQQGRAGVKYVVASANFYRQVVGSDKAMFRETGRAKINCLKAERWKHYPYRGRSVLFLLPPPAVGEHVAILLFLEAFRAQAQPKKVVLLGSDVVTDVYADVPWLTLYPAWMPHNELKQLKTVIDLNDVQSRRNIEFWPVDMEAELYKLFGLSAPAFTEMTPVRTSKAPIKIGILPLASSPLRTLPAAVILCLDEKFRAMGLQPRIVLNPYQHQTRVLRSALDAASPNLQYIDDTRSISDLLALMRELDYAIFADSGPAHLSKLEQRPGSVIFTSAPSDVLLGRHRNLYPIQIDYSGDFCKAPCGLAKLRQTSGGEVGCMASLQTSVENLPNTILEADPVMVRKMLLKTPVPCVAAAADAAEEIAGSIIANFHQRQH